MTKRLILLFFALHLALFCAGQSRYFQLPTGMVVDSVAYKTQKEQRLASFRATCR